MPYATPTAYLQRFGLAEATQLLADEEALLTTTLLQDALAGSWTGSPSAAEQSAGLAAAARLRRELVVSSSFIDSYLRAVVTLPLVGDDAINATLENCCLALARFGLADDSDNATDRIDSTAATWRAWLKDVAAKRVSLVSESGETPAAATSGIRTGQAASGFAWGGFGGVQ